MSTASQSMASAGAGAGAGPGPGPTSRLILPAGPLQSRFLDLGFGGEFYRADANRHHDKLLLPLQAYYQDFIARYPAAVNVPRVCASQFFEESKSLYWPANNGRSQSPQWQLHSRQIVEALIDVFSWLEQVRLGQQQQRLPPSEYTPESESPRSECSGQTFSSSHPSVDKIEITKHIQQLHNTGITREEFEAWLENSNPSENVPVGLVNKILVEMYTNDVYQKEDIERRPNITAQILHGVLYDLKPFHPNSQQITTYYPKIENLVLDMAKRINNFLTTRCPNPATCAQASSCLVHLHKKPEFAEQWDLRFKIWAQVSETEAQTFRKSSPRPGMDKGDQIANKKPRLEPRSEVPPSRPLELFLQPQRQPKPSQRSPPIRYARIEAGYAHIPLNRPSKSLPSLMEMMDQYYGTVKPVETNVQLPRIDQSKEVAVTSQPLRASPAPQPEKSASTRVAQTDTPPQTPRARSWTEPLISEVPFPSPPQSQSSEIMLSAPNLSGSPPSATASIEIKEVSSTLNQSQVSQLSFTDSIVFQLAVTRQGLPIWDTRSILAFPVLQLGAEEFFEWYEAESCTGSQRSSTISRVQISTADSRPLNIKTLRGVTVHRGETADAEFDAAKAWIKKEFDRTCVEVKGVPCAFRVRVQGFI